MGAGTPLAVLQLQLHGETVAHVARQPAGATALVFDPHWARRAQRPALTLCSTPMHPAHQELLGRPWLCANGLHPLLANLLPEAGLRPWLAQQLDVPADDDFKLLAALGHALPGAWRIRALAADEIPPGVLDFNARVAATAATAPLPPTLAAFAGSQPKRLHSDRRLLKLPTQRGQTRNEYSMLQLAKLAGVSCVEAELVAPTGNAASSVSDEPWLAVQRFDRDAAGTPLHTEDLAQALCKAPQQKYSDCDAVLLGRLLYRYTPQGLHNLQEFARRLLINVLLGNADAHLKNWSLCYQDGHTATLAPAYDIAFTQPLGVQQRLLAIGGCDDWYALEFAHFAQWCSAVGVPWRLVRPALLDTVERARSLWPAALEALPMAETDKLLLRHHWKSLTKKLQYGL